MLLNYGLFVSLVHVLSAFENNQLCGQFEGPVEESIKVDVRQIIPSPKYIYKTIMYMSVRNRRRRQ